MFTVKACNYTTTHKERGYEASANAQLSLSKTPASASFGGKTTPAETTVKKEDCGNEKCKTSACHKDWTPKLEAEVLAVHKEAAAKK